MLWLMYNLQFYSPKGTGSLNLIAFKEVWNVKMANKIWHSMSINLSSCFESQLSAHHVGIWLIPLVSSDQTPLSLLQHLYTSL